MTFAPRCHIPGLDAEAQRALGEIQGAIADEFRRQEQRAARPRRRVTELVEEGQVIAKPGEVVRVQPGDEDITVYLPDPGPGNGGEDIVVSFEGDGSAAGRVLVAPIGGTCALPGVVTLNSPGQYRYTSIGPTSAKPRAAGTEAAAAAGSPQVPSWSGPPALTTDDLPPIDTSELVDNSVDNTILDDMPANSVKVNGTGTPGDPTDLVIPPLSVLGRSNGDLTALTVPSFSDGIPRYLRSNSAGDQVAWATISEVSLPHTLDGYFYANMSGGTGQVLSKPLAGMAGAALAFNTSTVGDYQFDVTVGASLVLTASSGGQVERAALVGDVTAGQNSNTTAFRSFTGLSVLGRAASSSGVPTEITATAGLQYLRLNAAGTGLEWGTLTLASLPAQASDTVLGNISGSSATPVAVALADLDSTSIVYDAASHTFQRAALTGDVTASQNGNATTIANDAVTNAKLRDSAAVSVIGRSANSSGDPADIAAAADDRLLARTSSSLAFQQLTNGMVPTNTIGIDKLVNQAQSTVLGRAESAGTGAVTALSAAQIAAIIDQENITWTGTATWQNALRFFTGNQVESGSLPLAITLSATTTHLVITTNGDGDISSITGATSFGRAVFVHIYGTGTKTIKTGFGSDSALMCPGAVDFKCRQRDNFILVARGAAEGWAVYAAPAGSVFDGDKGDITVSALGATWTIDNNVVSDAKLRDSVALSVIGRSANSSGDPADIAAGADDRLLARTSSSLAFQQLTNGMVPTNTVGIDKLVNQAAATVLGRALGAGSGAVTALTGLQLAAILRPGNYEVVDLAGGATHSMAVSAGVNTVIVTSSSGAGDVSVAGIVYGGGGAAQAGATLHVYNFTGGKRVLLLHDSSSEAVDNNRLYAPNFATYTLTYSVDHAILNRNSLSSGDRWRIIDRVTQPDSVGNTELRNSGACSVIGRSANSSGDPADISAGSNDRLLARVSNALSFTQLTDGMVPADTLGLTKLTNTGSSLSSTLMHDGTSWTTVQNGELQRTTTITNTTSNTQLSSLSIVGGTASAGSQWTFEAMVNWSRSGTTSACSITIELTINGSAVVTDTIATATTTTVSSGTVFIRGVVACRATGGSGELVGYGEIKESVSVHGMFPAVHAYSGNNPTVDLTSNATLALRISMSAAATSFVLSPMNAYIQRVS